MGVELAAGDAFGRYQVVAPIGTGGMANVYRAHDTLLDRNVALKVLRTDRESDEDAVARFAREAKLAARLTHPNTVRVYDVGGFDATPFIAMEWIDGFSLSQIARRRDVGRDRLIRMLLGAGRGLAAALDVKLVHRDVKPSNIMVARDDTAKIVDFGLATRRSTSMNLRRLTGTGWILGTPQFMAPEQVLSADVDARADQFAWAMSAFVVLAGTNPRGSLEAGLERMPRLDAHVDVPRAVADVIARALEPSPDDRFPSMRALLDDFERALVQVSPPIVTAARKRILFCPGCATALDDDRRCARCGYVGARGGSLAPVAPSAVPAEPLRLVRKLYACSVGTLVAASFDPTTRSILAIGPRGFAHFEGGEWRADDRTLRGFSPDRVHCMTRLDDGSYLVGGDGALVVALDRDGGMRRFVVGHEAASSASLVAVDAKTRTFVGSGRGSGGLVVRVHPDGGTTAMSAPKLLTGIACAANGETYACATMNSLYRITDDDVVPLNAPAGLDLSTMIAAGSIVFATGPGGSACRIDPSKTDDTRVMREPAGTRAAIDVLAVHESTVWGMTTAGELLRREAGDPCWRLVAKAGAEHFRCVALHADARGVVALGSDGSLLEQS